MVSAPIQRGIRDFWPDSVQRSATDFPWFYRSCAAPNSWPHGATKQLYIWGDQGFKCGWEIRIMSCITQVLIIYVNHSIAWHFEYLDGTACFTVIIEILWILWKYNEFEYCNRDWSIVSHLDPQSQDSDGPSRPSHFSEPRNPHIIL